MTFEELNIVRTLKKQIAAENKKLKALKIIMGSFPHKYGKSNESGVTSGGSAKSAFESFVAQIVDCENKIAELERKVVETSSQLSVNIQKTFHDSTEQTFLLYRFVACKYFREIGFLIGLSERRVYQLYENILQKYFS